MTNDERYIELAIEEAQKAPWPFGAVIVIAGEIVAQAGAGDGENNSVDPTAHAEVNAIRFACKKLGAHDLLGRDAAMYASCEPCLMCMGAIWYAGIRKVVYGSTIAEEEQFFTWGEGDISLPQDTLSVLMQNKLEVINGVMKDAVMDMYKQHSAHKV